MSETSTGLHIKKAIFVIGGFGVGYMIGTHGEPQLGVFSWLKCGLIGMYAGHRLSE
ncbi:MAG: hypothetical protein HOH50_16450 [Planctomycetaceae bacterium]|jgi:hypothetical protein|nr:hypothetical protein [Planctomycetaceae bacterium]